MSSSPLANIGGTPEDMLQQANAAELGLVLGPMAWQQAIDLRRRLYSERERQRKAGVDAFDALSCLIREARRGLGFELTIIKRTKVPKGSCTYSYRQRPLMPEEMPSYVGARGRRRHPLLTILQNSEKFRAIPHQCCPHCAPDHQLEPVGQTAHQRP